MVASKLDKDNYNKLNSPFSSFGSNFLKPHIHRKSRIQKEVEAKKLALSIKDILLEVVNNEDTQKTMKALQDPIILERVFNALKYMPAYKENKADHFTLTKKARESLKESNNSNNSNTKIITKSYSKKAFDTPRGGKRINKSNKNKNKINPRIAELALVFEKKEFKSQLSTRKNKRNRISTDKEELISNENPDIINVIKENSKSSTPLKSFNYSEASSSSIKINLDISKNTSSINSELKSLSESSLGGITLKESHILKDSYVNKLRRRHAVKRSKPIIKVNPTLTIPNFDPSLPLDEKPKYFDPLKKYFGLISPKKGNKNKNDDAKLRHKHHLQRAYLPVELIENMPISEQVKVFINKEEVEAYRKSGMTHLDMKKVDINVKKESNYSPGLLSSVHDIWYEDLTPPKDGVSVYVYWWGYEVYVPLKVLEELKKQGSMTTSIIAFITAITIAVPLIQPILKILSAFITMESSASDLFHSDIGTVLTATWILPFLVIPRAWH